ncbi:MAG: lipopolysaccharide biosynthesis protein [Oscillospiraceae bacterium]
MDNSRTSNVLKNSTANLLYKSLHILLQFALRTAFIKILGKEYTGVSTLFTDILQVLSLMDLGIGTAMTFALYKPLAEKDTEKIGQLMNFYKKAYTLIGIAIFAVGMCLVPFLDFLVKDVPNIKESIRSLFILYLLTTASSYFLVYKATILRASQKSRVISAVDSVVFTVESIAEIVLLLLFKQFYAYLITHFLFTLGRNIVLSFYTGREYGDYFEKKGAKLPRPETQKLFRDISALAIYKISGKVIYSTDSIVISAFVGTQDVAVIGNFNLVINSLRTTIEQVVESTKASIGNLAVTSSKEKQEQIFRQMNFIAFWVSCFCCTCLFVLLNPFVGEIWFDASYQIPMELIGVSVANFFIAVMVYPVESFRNANGLFVQGRYRPAIMAVLNIVLDLVFVHFWGIFGVLFATTISRLCTQVWFDPYLVYKHVFQKAPWGYFRNYIVQVLLTVGSCALAWEIANLFTISNVYIGFLYKAVVAVATPNLILFLLFRKTEEYQGLLRTGTRLLKKITKKRLK